MSGGIRRVWAVRLAFGMALAVTGCGSDQPAAAPESEQDPTKAAERTPTQPPAFDE